MKYETIPGYEDPAGYTQITSLAAAAGLGTIPTGTRLAVIQCEAQAVRYRDDGTDPTTSVGMRMTPGSILTYAGPMAALVFIEEAASAKLNVSFYK